MPFEIKESAKPQNKKRAAKKPNTSGGHANVNPSMDESVTRFAKSTTNPEFESFEGLVDSIRKEVRKTVDYRKSVNDDSPETLKKYTSQTIKKLLRGSKWA